ncbi:MAG: metalloregulator ArsR/SmtB family transcription factor [Candidatus Zixiibacteriota bacterium]
MDNKTKAHFEAKARIIKAMAHPTRLFIVDELSRKERCVCELTEMIGADTSTVSKHLSILRAAGIVQDEKRGLQVFYSLKVPCILNFFGCVSQVQKLSAKEQVALAERK